MHPGPDFNDCNGRGLFLAGVSKTPQSKKSEVFLIPADKKYAVIMLMDHCIHGTERWSTDAPKNVYRTSYNFRLMINAKNDPIEIWQEIISRSWN
ncbi:MAG: hypothetical protein AB8G05_26390 [Oligoflexales bacterium]